MTHVSRPTSVCCTPSHILVTRSTSAIALGTPEITLPSKAVRDRPPVFLLPTRLAHPFRSQLTLSPRGQRERSRCLPGSRPSLPGSACSVVSLPPRSLTRLVFASSAGSSSISPRFHSCAQTERKATDSGGANSVAALLPEVSLAVLVDTTDAAPAAVLIDLSSPVLRGGRAPPRLKDRIMVTGQVTRPAVSLE